MSLSSSVMKRLAARRNEDPDLLERTSFPAEFRISWGGHLLASLLLRLAHQTGQDGELSYDAAREGSKKRDEKRNRKELVVFLAVMLPLLVVYYIWNN